MIARGGDAEPTLYHGNVMDVYTRWSEPDLIVSDGAYGVRGFRGDTTDASGLVRASDK